MTKLDKKVNFATKLRQCLLLQQGVTPYQQAWEKQRSLVQQRIDDPTLPDILMLLEHTPVYTLGTGANVNFVKFNTAESDKEIYRVERGGEVSYHCPGQLVGYPILNLRHYQQDLHWYLRQLEEVIIRVLQFYDLEGYRMAGFTGVWVEGHKVAAIGIKVTRWITMHGFALNCCPDLIGFQQIVPCGIENLPVGSLAQFLGDINLQQVRLDIATAFSEVFQVELITDSMPE